MERPKLRLPTTKEWHVPGFVIDEGQILGRLLAALQRAYIKTHNGGSPLEFKVVIIKIAG